MPRKVDGTPKSRTPVRAVRHDGETRANIPTAELEPQRRVDVYVSCH